MWVWIVIGTLVLSCGGCVGLVGLASNTSSTKTTTAGPVAAKPSPSEQPAAPTPAAPPKNDVAPAGSAVRDGQFEFVITNVEQGTTRVGGGFWGEEAKGEFVLVSVDISNVGKRAQTYFGSNQVLIDDQNREFEASFSANAALNDYGSHEDLNPGHKVSVVIAFDVPVGVVPVAIEFHGSMFSGGAKVAVR
ncbi:Telomeric repeat-binding factor 2 [Nocardia otitidiscaviarum]|uniref:Telomeric repeat-binding factor 2 n=1 Tax=Nocardia otitidiscaviarum TaxID=1823 RepID=A0A379JLI9_9NOCA|nr:Telomeric repeat-binding factor 2 [Nocardia otitidiscaviarum]